MNYNEILKKGENILKKNKIKNPYLDTELILSKVVNRKREQILLNTSNKLKNWEIIAFKNYIESKDTKFDNDSDYIYLYYFMGSRNGVNMNMPISKLKITRSKLQFFFNNQ